MKNETLFAPAHIIFEELELANIDHNQITKIDKVMFLRLLKGVKPKDFIDCAKYVGDIEKLKNKADKDRFKYLCGVIVQMKKFDNTL